MKVQPPGPKSSVFGLDHAQSFRADALQFLLHLRREYGDVVCLKMGPANWYVFNHPDFVKEILVTRAKEFGKSAQFKRILTKVDGNGLVVSEGSFWLKQRRTIQPIFAHEHLSRYEDIILAQTEQRLVKWLPNETFDIAERVTDITLAVAARIFLGVDVTGREQQLAHAVDVLSRSMYQEFTTVIPLPDWLPIPSKVDKRQAIATLESLCKEGIEAERRAAHSGSLLGLLLNARDTESGDGTMGDEQVLSEAKTMFNAGHDSTAATLAWCFYLLAKNPEAYQRVLDEADRDESNYAELCIKEALRLYPSAWLLPRQALADTELGGYQIPEGSFVNVSPFVIQRDERFFPEPERFRPERFSESENAQHHPFAWFPFGAGPRACIGRDFAIMEMRLIIRAVSKKFRLEFVPEQAEVEMNPLLSLEPRNGIQVKAVPR